MGSTGGAGLVPVGSVSVVFALVLSAVFAAPVASLVVVDVFGSGSTGGTGGPGEASAALATDFSVLSSTVAASLFFAGSLSPSAADPWSPVLPTLLFEAASDD